MLTALLTGWEELAVVVLLTSLLTVCAGLAVTVTVNVAAVAVLFEVLEVRAASEGASGRCRRSAPTDNCSASALSASCTCERLVFARMKCGQM